MGSITANQFVTLMRPLNTGRVAHRRQGGKELSYLEAWDVKAHLIRVFGFGNFDIETHHVELVYADERPFENNTRWYVCYRTLVTLTIRDPEGSTIATYTEGSANEFVGPVGILGDLHDNAIKAAASDALKRCAINLGSQFGLSLYDDGSSREVVKGSLVKPGQDEWGYRFVTPDEIAALPWTEGTMFMVIDPEPEIEPVPGAVTAPETDEQTERIAASLGATVVADEPEGNQDSAANAKSEAADQQS